MTKTAIRRHHTLRLVNKFRRDNKLAKDINLISTREQYYY